MAASQRDIDYFDFIGDEPIDPSKVVATYTHEDEKREDLLKPSDALVPLNQTLVPSDAAFIDFPEEKGETLSEEEVIAFIRRHAWQNTVKYFHRYWPADGSFTLGLNLVVYSQTGVFDCDATGSFTQEEMLAAYGIFCGIFPLYYFICEMLDGEKILPALWSSQKFGWQFWYFYFLDRDYGENFGDIAVTCILMGMLVFLLDTLPNIIWMYASHKAKHCFSADEEIQHVDMKKEILKIATGNLGEALAVTVGTACWWGPYFLPIEGVLGMFVKGLLSGWLGNAGASPLVYLCEYYDIKNEVITGELIPKTLQQEQEEAKLLPPSFSTRTTNYFRSWIFKETVKQQQLLTQENKEDFVERKEDALFVKVSQGQSTPKTGTKSQSGSKPKSYEQANRVVEMRAPSDVKTSPMKRTA